MPNHRTAGIRKDEPPAMMAGREEMQNMKPCANMVTLGVKNMEKATQFYKQGFGLPRMPFEERARKTEFS